MRGESEAQLPAAVQDMSSPLQKIKSKTTPKKMAEVELREGHESVTCAAMLEIILGGTSQVFWLNLFSYFCSAITHFWPGKYPLPHISINPTPTPTPPPYMNYWKKCVAIGREDQTKLIVHWTLIICCVDSPLFQALCCSDT